MTNSEARKRATCDHVSGYYTNQHSGATCWDCGEVPPDLEPADVGHGFIDPMEPHRQRIQALEAQVAELSAADRRPEHDSGDYYTFTKAELDAHDEKVRSQAAASQVQGAAEVGADVEALARVIHRTWCNSSHHRTERCQKQIGDVTRAKAIIAAGWVPAERVAEARAEELRAAADQLVADGPGVNAELRYDGTPDPGMSGYVEGLHDAWQMLTTRASALDGDQGGGLLDEDGGA